MEGKIKQRKTTNERKGEVNNDKTSQIKRSVRKK